VPAIACFRRDKGDPKAALSKLLRPSPRKLEET